MSAAVAARVRRGGLHRASRIVVVLLLPIAVWSLWDYVEARRLSRTVGDIRGRGEPVTTLRPQTRLEDLPGNAARYYVAAAALLDSKPLYDGPESIMQALRFRRGDRAATIGRVRHWLTQNAEAERLLGLATSAEFSGFAPGTDYSYRANDMANLATAADLRMLERLAAGDGDGAARALVAEVRLARTADKSAFGGEMITWTVERALHECAALLHARPGEPALAQLATVLREQDDEVGLREQVLNARAYLIDSIWNESGDWYGRPTIRFDSPLTPLTYLALRPWFAHRVNEELRRLNVAVEQAQRPWPERASFPDVSPWRGPARVLGFRFDHPVQAVTALVGRHFQATARRLAIVRTAATAVAVERYRLAQGGQMPSRLEDLVPTFLAAVPVDPYSGAAVKLVRSQGKYVVYSFGVNRKDEGGTQLRAPNAKPGAREQLDLAPDIGVEVALTDAVRDPSGGR